jgi:hypothetical protein
MNETKGDDLQAAVDAAFPALHGGEEFRDEPALRATLEVPVRAALVAAGLAEVTAERDRLQEAHALLRIAVLNIADNDGAWLPGRAHWRDMARTALAADVTAMGDPEGYALDIERWAMRAPKAREAPRG